MDPIPTLPDWIPSERHGARTLPAGRWWDAVVVDSFTAIYVLGRLIGRSGPVVEDQGRQLALWLLPPGAAANWDLPGVQVLGHGHYVTIPPAEWCWGPWWEDARRPIRWLVPLLGEDHRADPAALHLALARTVAEPPARPAWGEAAGTVVTGLEGPVEPTLPVVCGYCHHRVVADDDHATTCPWKSGKASAR
ncbi:hypothetical protein [Streptomyces hainanensis]|uniref:Uncharacterized protein n=1 Tax=Streptomyces hainanensis TaxID=402648 RepID=A0A4R4SUL8_9ACTN|nr:hypothetical protein [Streptomyces hainanensis]TDC67777.1 hypothetical protein E1283_28350 [Streptomyces hainanensis]